MAKAKIDAFEVGCPCCGALLKIDPETRAVIAHTPPARPKTFNDFEEAARAMREQDHGTAHRYLTSHAKADIDISR